MVNNFRRLTRHLLVPPWRVRQIFPARALRAIATAIGEAEATHAGQICFAVEAALDFIPLVRGQSARERALAVFAQLGAWDTEKNNGVLIYLLLADRDVEIIADRGIHQRVNPQEWERICREMESMFKNGDFVGGVHQGIAAIGALLARHYPRTGSTANELPDAPIVL